MKNKLGILGLLSIVLLSACTTDFDVVGDWKETMVVYGLLDQGQGTGVQKQYIKVNKAFLGEGNALEYAQIKDSVQFSNALSVSMQRIKNGAAVGAPIVFTQDNSIPKDPGTFYSASQGNAIYSCTNTIFDDSDYKLTIRNTETGKEVTAQTGLVKDFGALSQPAPGAAVASLVNTLDSYTYNVKFNSAANARLYQVVIRFNYIDSTTSGNVADSIDWIQSTNKTATLNGGEEMNYSFKGQDFMRFIGGSLHDYTGLVHRTPGNLKIVVISAADELSTFIDVNKPSTSIIQEKPEYTNISGGLGIFSARMTKVAFNRPLASQTKDTLSKGRYTHCLKFLGSSGVWLGLGIPCN